MLWIIPASYPASVWVCTQVLGLANKVVFDCKSGSDANPGSHAKLQIIIFSCME